MPAENSYRVVRISKSADDKLSEISRRNHLSKSSAATRIISYHYSKKIGTDLPSPEDYQNIISELKSNNARLLTISGAVQRTEIFIKTLVDDRPNPSITRTGLPDSGEHADSEVDTAPGHKQDLTNALEIIRQFLTQATSSSSFDGKSVMQIKVPTPEFNKLKAEYDRLCSSQTM